MKLRITADGTVQGLWDDAVDWLALGPVAVRRASHVEFCVRRQRWYVQAARPRGRLRRLLQFLLRCPLGEVLCWADTREQALAWEADHFCPGGDAWEAERYPRWDRSAARRGFASVPHYPASARRNQPVDLLHSVLRALTKLLGFRQSVRDHNREQAYGPHWSRHRSRHIPRYRRRSRCARR